jgi:hypothetical protein
MFEDHQKYHLEKQSAQILHRPFHLFSECRKLIDVICRFQKDIFDTVSPILQKIGRSHIGRHSSELKREPHSDHFETFHQKV